MLQIDHPIPQGPGTILWSVPEASILDTTGKWLMIASLLEKDGYPIHLLVWSQEGETGAKALELPYTYVRTKTNPIQAHAEAEKLEPLLQWPIAPDGPLWSDIFLLDDYIGVAQGVKIGGVEGLAPKALVIPYAGGENTSIVDEHLRLILWRWTQTNKIPVIALQTQSLGSWYEIHRAPADRLITKKGTPDEPPWYPRYTYCLSHGRDMLIEECLQQEAYLLGKIRGEDPPKRYLLIPHHMYYLSETIKALQELAPKWPALAARGYELLFTIGGSYRRSLTELEIVTQGFGRWLPPFGKFRITKDMSTLSAGLLSDAILIPYPSVMIQRFRDWGLQVLEHEDIRDLPGSLIPYSTPHATFSNYL